MHSRECQGWSAEFYSVDDPADDGIKQEAKG